MINNTLIGDFKRPKSATYKLIEGDKNTAVFSAGPYEKSIATTIGNSLRRILLSSLPGYAVIGVKFDKINNEYDNIPGVLEDTTIICLNLKRLAIFLKDDNIKTKILNFTVKGKMKFKAKEIEKVDSAIKVSNPEAVIFNTNNDADFSFTLQIGYGRGYVDSEYYAENIEVKGTIVLDADFSPIEQCGFLVKMMKLGTKNDFEKLELRIKTKGVISPEEALKKAAQILKESYLTFNEVEEDNKLTTPIESRESATLSEKDMIFHETVHDLPLLVKSYYFLKINNIHEIGQLVTKSEIYLKSKKGFDDEILEDIIENLELKHLNLNMKGINYLESS